MTKKRFNSNYDIQKCKTNVENVSSKSETVPNQSRTVREVMKRYASGNPPAIAKQPIWNQHPTFDSYERDLEKMDLVEALELKERMSERLEEIKEQQKEIKAQEEKKLVDKLKDLNAKIKEAESRVTPEPEVEE